MKSICGFIPSKNTNGTLNTVHFVYETEHGRLRWPSVAPIYYLFLVVHGSGELKMTEIGTFSIQSGSLFLIPPGTQYEICGESDLTYLYISFMGTRAPDLTDNLHCTVQSPVHNGHTDCISFWMQALRRLNSHNANLIAEGVLLYTLSYLTIEKKEDAQTQTQGVVQSILDYIDHNYQDTALNLKKVADIFGYTDKYLSHLFKQHVRINWRTYLNRLRIQHATALINEGKTNVTELAQVCGFEDTLYFSKVFKKHMGKTPHGYIKAKENKKTHS